MVISKYKISLYSISGIIKSQIINLSIYLILPYIKSMQFKTKMLMMAFGSLLIASFSFLRFWRKKKAIEEEVAIESQYEEKQLYTNEVEDPVQHRLKNVMIKQIPFTSLHYTILLNLNKGNMYEGVVIIQFDLHPVKQLSVDFNGSHLSYFSVNGVRIKEGQIRYVNHEIELPQNLLRKQKNKVQIIFSNKYSFLDDGFASYFRLDQQNKYSLKQQVIFTKNGPSEITRIIPCFNSMHSCTINLTLLHPQHFQSYSNVSKSSIELCSVHDYPQYSFFFQSAKLNRSLNNSTIFTNSHVNPQLIIKTMTKFYPINLHSIHQLFIYCSFVHEQVSSQHELFIRYVYKDYMSQYAKIFLPLLQKLIQSVTKAMHLQMTSKLDIFFVNDSYVDGYFEVGALILNEEWLTMEQISEEVHYLICRSLVSLGKNKKVPKSLNEILNLNQQTYQIFEELQDFIALKQIQFSKIKQFGKNQESIKEYQYVFIQYYEKELRFITSQQNKTNNERLNSIIHQMINHQVTAKAFWLNLLKFVNQKNSEKNSNIQLLLQISLIHRVLPSQIDKQLHQQSKKAFIHYKVFLQFLSDEQVQQNLQQFIKKNTYGIEKRLPRLRISQKLREYLIDNENLKQFLPAKSNQQQIKIIYQQFKRFSQTKNFHHLNVLIREAKRVQIFLSHSLHAQQRDLECGLMCWKVLTILKIFPQDHIYRKIILTLFSLDQTLH